MNRFASKIIFLGLLVTSYWLLVTYTYAQTSPQVIITWQAYNYYPSDYPGKAQATPFSQILAAVEVIENNRLLDLSQADINWFIDGKFVNNGLGLKENLFSINKVPGDAYLIRVLIQFNNKTIEGFKKIIINTPELIINSPFPNNIIPAGQDLLFEAIPYFFNIKSLEELSFSWQANNEPAPQFKSNQILINFDPTQTNISNELNLNVFVQNLSNPRELKKASLKLWAINQ